MLTEARGHQAARFSNMVQTKPRRVFFGGSFGRAFRGGKGSGKNSPGQKSNFFPRHVTPGGENFDIFLTYPSPARKFFDFFLAMAGNWLIFVCFGEEFVRVQNKWFELRTIYFSLTNQLPPCIDGTPLMSLLLRSFP